MAVSFKVVTRPIATFIRIACWAVLMAQEAIAAINNSSRLPFDVVYQHHHQQQHHYQDIDKTCSGQMPVLLRGAWARSIYDRMLREEELKNFDKRKWYHCDLDLVSEDLRSSFIKMHCDEQSQDFIDNCYAMSEWHFTHLFHSVARTVLCLFMSSTSINGLLGRGSMFVFSDKQFTALMGDSLKLSRDNGSVLLDLGAGDGKVTQVMGQHFAEVHVTEISPVMRKILARRGFTVIDVNAWSDAHQAYDLISCLNLLDRCDTPLTILKQMKASLKPGSGRILLALVLPLSQYVESNGRPDHRPAEVLPVEGSSFEAQMTSFREEVLRPIGLDVERWTKLPYLCEGDLDLTYYWLYDVVMLVKPIG